METCDPYLLKMISDKEYEFVKELIKINPRALSHDAILKVELHMNRFLMMEIFPTTLEHFQQIGKCALTKVYTAIESALLHLHESGLAHSDIKPANIFMARGQIVVGDLGSLAYFGSLTTSTKDFIPFDLLHTLTTASKLRDWWMLALTLYDRSSGPAFQIGSFDSGKAHYCPDSSAILASLSQRLNSDTYNKLVVHIKDCTNEYQSLSDEG